MNNNPNKQREDEMKEFMLNELKTIETLDELIPWFSEVTQNEAQYNPFSIIVSHDKVTLLRLFQPIKEVSLTEVGTRWAFYLCVEAMIETES